MPCSARGCDLDDGLELHPCNVCEKPVHHVCSNELYDDGPIDLK